MTGCNHERAGGKGKGQYSTKRPSQGEFSLCGLRRGQSDGLRLRFLKGRMVPRQSGFRQVNRRFSRDDTRRDHRAVLDEAMSKAIIARDWEALTADLRVRFRARIVRATTYAYTDGWSKSGGDLSGRKLSSSDCRSGTSTCLGNVPRPSLEPDTESARRRARLIWIHLSPCVLKSKKLSNCYGARPNGTVAFWS